MNVTYKIFISKSLENIKEYIEVSESSSGFVKYEHLDCKEVTVIGNGGLDPITSSDVYGLKSTILNICERYFENNCDFEQPFLNILARL